MFETNTDRDDAQINVTVEANVGIIDIQSESGIGRGQVDLLSGQWPERLLLQFHLSGLEGMQFQYGETTVSVSITSSGLVLQDVAIDGEQRPIGEESKYWMPVRFATANGSTATEIQAEGVIEVEAPSDFLENDFGGFTLEWIDFYR